MAWRSIVLSVFTLAACSGGSGSNTTDDGPDPSQGKILKVTILRFHTDERTRKPVPEYRVMLSSAWKAKYGETPREPMARLYRRGSRSPFLGEVPDEKLVQLLHELDRKGIAKLKSVDPETIDLVALQNAERNETESQVTRIITIGDDQGSRSYLLKTIAPFTEERKIFDACEREVLKMAVQFTAQVSVSSNPVAPKD